MREKRRRPGDYWKENERPKPQSTLPYCSRCGKLMKRNPVSRLWECECGNIEMDEHTNPKLF